MRQFEVQPFRRPGTTTLLQSGLSGVLYHVTMSGDIFALGENEMDQTKLKEVSIWYIGEMGEREQRSPLFRKKQRNSSRPSLLRGPAAGAQGQHRLCMDLAEGSTQASEPSFPIPSATRTHVSHGDDRPEWQEDSQQIPSIHHITSTKKLN